jgi:hypothetical protein
LLETSLNLFVKFDPTVETAVIMATAINPAISPYSIAVAPLPLFKNAEIILQVMVISDVEWTIDSETRFDISSTTM